jgi:hypothetical protein
VEAAGIEPASVIEQKEKVATTYVNCPSCCAAVALHFGVSGCLESSAIDKRISTLIGAWDRLPENIRLAIAELCRI